jgi:insecticidal toxin complex protein TccC
MTKSYKEIPKFATLKNQQNSKQQKIVPDIFNQDVPDDNADAFGDTSAVDLRATNKTSKSTHDAEYNITVKSLIDFYELKSAPPHLPLQKTISNLDVLQPRITGEVARAQVAKSFILDLHMPAIEKVSREKNMAVSFREAGSSTIEALKKGAAAKGHNILEKTIKLSSVESVYRSQSSDIMLKAEENKLKGLVGAWKERKNTVGSTKRTLGIEGVYVHNNQSGDDEKFSVDLGTPHAQELLHALNKFKIVTPYTGDYDMHDIILFSESGDQGRIPEADSSEEKDVINSINKEVAFVDSKRPFENTAMNVIRHGPQVNFVQHMWESEREKVVSDNGYLGIVANPGPFPVAVVNRGDWEILESKQELVDFYKRMNTPLPSHWETDALIDRQNGYVATQEHIRILNPRR